MNLLFRFVSQNTGSACGDVAATLTGETLAGGAIAGKSSIVTVKCP
jgi:hypothetical protein